jgi:hypothetical protein
MTKSRTEQLERNKRLAKHCVNQAMRNIRAAGNPFAYKPEHLERNLDEAIRNFTDAKSLMEEVGLEELQP